MESDKDGWETERHVTTQRRVITSRGFSEEFVTKHCNTKKCPLFLLEMVGKKSLEDKLDSRHVMYRHNNHANVPECATSPRGARPSGTDIRSTALPHVNTS